MRAKTCGRKHVRFRPGCHSFGLKGVRNLKLIFVLSFQGTYSQSGAVGEGKRGKHYRSTALERHRQPPAPTPFRGGSAIQEHMATNSGAASHSSSK